MTKQEASERYLIPMDILDQYEKWGLCNAVKKVMGDWKYDDTDLERLSLIMTLHQIGFSKEEIGSYMQLYLEGDKTAAERLRIVEQKRDRTLEEIHFHEMRLNSLDTLRYEIGNPINQSDCCGMWQTNRQGGSKYE